MNNGNMKTGARNKSGIKGVSWSKKYNKWYASIQKNYKSYNLGYYSDINDAANDYRAAANHHFGEFARAA
jgi:hypothetical protein